MVSSMNDYSHHDADAESIVSKSAKKRESVEMLSTVEALILLPTGKLDALDLEENLQLAISQAKTMRRNGARKRQVAFIRTRLMKMPEDELSAITGLITQVENRSQQQMASVATAEYWAARLVDVAQQKPSFEQWINQYPQSDAQQLRSLQRNAIKSQTTDNEISNNPARKKLVLWLKNYIDESINE